MLNAQPQTLTGVYIYQPQTLTSCMHACMVFIYILYGSTLLYVHELVVITTERARQLGWLYLIQTFNFG
jgi:hypothetical protein